MPGIFDTAIFDIGIFDHQPATEGALAKTLDAVTASGTARPDRPVSDVVDSRLLVNRQKSPTGLSYIFRGRTR